MPTYSPAFPMPALIHKRGSHEGYPWVVTKAPRLEAYNGYVHVPKDHPWMAYDYDKGEIPDNNVPFGEITFHRGQWFGFDTMHHGQYWPELVAYYNNVNPGSGDFLLKTWNDLPALKMTVEHVLTWVIQLCIDARDAYNDKE